MKKFTDIFFLLAIGLIINAVVALPIKAQVVGEQFYFTAISAPQGSISIAGQSANGVYLRWGVLEGQLPADVVSLRLVLLILIK